MIEDLPSYPLMSGPDIEKAIASVRDWWVNYKVNAVRAMTDPYPYGSVPLTPEEQYSNYKRLRPEDIMQMRLALMRIYQGAPDASTRVDDELRKYQSRMEALGTKLQSGMKPGEMEGLL